MSTPRVINFVLAAAFAVALALIVGGMAANQSADTFGGVAAVLENATR